MNVLDIRSKSDYPAGEISNFAQHCFKIDGVGCSSMEGFLQSLKTPDPSLQREICSLSGRAAKAWGEENSELWKESQTLWWYGVGYGRHSQEYQDLINRAYDELFKNEEFRKALRDTGDCVLTHTVGNPDPHDTVLTEEELCSRLMKLREKTTP